MRILHIFDHSIPLQSGYTFRSRNILLHQRSLGWETCHVTSCKHAGGTNDKEVIDGLEFYRTNDISQAFRKLPLVNQFQVVSSLSRKLDEVIKKEKPDILHAHSPALNGLAALAAAKRFDLPVVYECRAFWEDAAVDHGTSRAWGSRYRLTRALETHVFKRCSSITTICEGLRKEIESRGINENKITVIPNAVNIQDFPVVEDKDQSLLRELGLVGKIAVGFIGSFYAYEGLSILIEAVAQIIKSHPEYSLVLVGGGPEEDRLKAQVKKLKLDDHVVFTGRVPHGEVPRYYSIIDILAYPRLSMRLTDLVTPLKPLEAMAQKRLFVASDVGGHRELIQHEKTGLLFKAGSVSSLVEAILRIATEKSLALKLKEAGRAFVETERNWTVSVDRYKPMYEELLV